MKVIVVKDSREGGQKGCEIFQSAYDNGAKVFGFATGSTPITTYENIITSNMNFTKMSSVNLDEYIGLSADCYHSYHFFMQKHLFNKKPFLHSYFPNGDNNDVATEIARYDKIIEENPIDLQLLGLGQNGHIGFNEPGTDPELTTHKVSLSESTIKANSRFFDSDEEVPRYAYSMGILSIIKSYHILIEAYGKTKANAVKAMINGPITSDVPASFLQNHSDVTVILDESAASKLMS